MTTPRINYANVNELLLDPTNPRLGRRISSPATSQEDIIERMKDWTLDELAISFIESGFWPQEALIVIKEVVYGRESLVVVEGNRRLAALKLLEQAATGNPVSRKWAEIADSGSLPTDFFANIPYILVDDRLQVSAYLGFRHVTGIKEWSPAEKAEYIAKLIEGEHLSYDQVRRKIGSKTPTVRQHYISYRILLQMEDHDRIAIEEVEKKFSVLYLSLRTSGVQKYLQIDIKANPEDAISPVPEERLNELANFALWLFGDEKNPPLFSDSRKVDDFGKILESDEAVSYLERSEKPNFDMAFKLAGGDELEVARLIRIAADNLQLALSTVHLYKKSENIQNAVNRLGTDAIQLLNIFPSIKDTILAEE